MFAELVPPGTFRTIALTTTDMDRSLTTRMRTDVSQPADQVMYVLWAAAGLEPDPSALFSRYEQGEGHRYFGITGSWENSANREAVVGINTVQFGQLFLENTELYAEIDPARGWRARVSLEPADELAAAALGETGSTVQVVQDPFGIPSTMTAAQTDVLLKASDGEWLSPLEQQILVQLDEPVGLPNTEISQAIALATLHAVRLGVAPEHVQLIPMLMVEMPYAMAARELLRFLQETDDQVRVTKTGKLPVAELRRILQDPYMYLVLVGEAEWLNPATVQLKDVPHVAEAWGVLQQLELIVIEHQRAHVQSNLSWLKTVTNEEFDSYFEAVFLRYVVEHDLVDGDDLADAGLHPTLEYETAQEYADSLISSALAAPEDILEQLLDEQLFEVSDPDEQREHIVFTIELLYVSEPVTRRMSVPLDANFHASIETILIMFGWGLTHLWQVDVVGTDGDVQPAAAAYRDEYLDVPLAADLDVAALLHMDGPQLLLTYDFGDGWEMLITPVETRTAGSAAELLAAVGSCPPEDAGGPGGYEMKLLAVADPAEFQRQYPDFESEEIRDLGNWMRNFGAGQHVPEPDFYELDEHALPYEF